MDLQIGLTQNGQKPSKTLKIMPRTLENLCLVVKTMPKGLNNMPKPFKMVLESVATEISRGAKTPFAYPPHYAQAS